MYTWVFRPRYGQVRKQTAAIVTAGWTLGGGYMVPKTLSFEK